MEVQEMQCYLVCDTICAVRHFINYGVHSSVMIEREWLFIASSSCDDITFYRKQLKSFENFVTISLYISKVMNENSSAA